MISISKLSQNILMEHNYKSMSSSTVESLYHSMLHIALCIKDIALRIRDLVVETKTISENTKQDLAILETFNANLLIVLSSYDKIKKHFESRITVEGKSSKSFDKDLQAKIKFYRSAIDMRNVTLKIVKSVVEAENAMGMKGDDLKSLEEKLKETDGLDKPKKVIESDKKKE